LSTDTELSESDAELVSRFQRGDRSAFTALVRRWEGPMVRIAYRITSDLAEAEDLRQRVFLKLLEAPGSVAQPERFAAWMRRTMVNAAIVALRRRRRREGLHQRLRARAMSVDDAHPGAGLMADEQARRLADAMLQLDAEARALLALRFDEDLTYSEIAAALDRPVSTVKSQVARAIARLRTMLADPCDGARS
jgi:RNA polymerase sigma-70 factor, ECF subfamily